jgi:hypothetical protein
MDQLYEVAKILNSINGLQYIFDSGTILGLHRDSKLIENDLDIDISIFEHNNSHIDKIINLFERSGYRYRVIKYGLEPYKLKLKKNGYKRTIDINFFRISPNGKYYFCPQPATHNGNRFIKKIRQVFIFIIVSIVRKYHLNINYYNYILRLFYTHYTWLIPANFFINRSIIHNVIKCPRDIEDYLFFRYGDWKVKNKGWNFIKDDKGLKHISPDNFFKY